MGMEWKKGRGAMDTKRDVKEKRRKKRSKTITASRERRRKRNKVTLLTKEKGGNVEIQWQYMVYNCMKYIDGKLGEKQWQWTNGKGEW